MSTQTVEIQISKDGKRLETTQGQALYYFKLQEFDPYHKGNIPWMLGVPGLQPGFPEFMQKWITQWQPLIGNPVFQGNEAESSVSQKDFNDFNRAGEPMMGQAQITFKKWYVYTFTADTDGTANGEIAGMWKLLPVNLKGLVEGVGISDQSFTGGP